MKNKEHLPIFGIGPFLVVGMAVVAAIAIAVFSYVLHLGTVSVFPATMLIAIGIALIIAGLIVWFIGAVRSGMDDNIKENCLKTNGIYAWVRNPMYSGWWMLITGISLMWRNIFLIPVIVINWGIMTVVLKATEEKWLHELYGQEYDDYCKCVNRCIPFKRK
ncbi:methyltransferase family protein [Ruminococcus flavefaciens]|uniref:Protein-S-isoprenylcysteine O-methyltransferase Ste14 n=1 Tax=Ruminococcus flavefaciens TaxID=1265 RepID=A0A1K1N0K7_RUMFL|nr:isoprenylcysteine carboxylmethyltransferase family protein [Ruminococcus flavefaciens]SFW27814.1 Protein-S-isoprenylcysteine O-methyltransferase Ste14 [Ruminococcus flavefaciens]